MRGRVAAGVLVQFVVLLALAILIVPAEAQQVREIDQCTNNLVSPTLTITRAGR